MMYVVRRWLSWYVSFIHSLINVDSYVPAAHKMKVGCHAPGKAQKGMSVYVLLLLSHAVDAGGEMCRDLEVGCFATGNAAKGMSAYNATAVDLCCCDAGRSMSYALKVGIHNPASRKTCMCYSSRPSIWTNAVMLSRCTG